MFDNWEYSELIPITIGGTRYYVHLAQTIEEKKLGLSLEDEMDDDEGCLFVYEQPEDVTYTCEDMSFPIDIVFIGEDAKVISVWEMEAHDPEEVSEEDVQFVLEVNADSGIQEGDKLEGDLWEDDGEDEDAWVSKTNNKALMMLGPDGNVQYRITPGARIYSRIFTRKLIKKALQAYRTDDDAAYKKVAKMVFKELDAQDGREAQYVSLPGK